VKNEELKKLERATDMDAIDYFEASLKVEALEGDLRLARFKRDQLAKQFTNSKIAHLKAKWSK